MTIFERRKDIIVKLRIKGYLVAGTQYDELKVHTKPFMTVYVNPTRSFVSSIIYSTTTLTVFFCDRSTIKLPQWSINFTTLNNIVADIMRVYDENCQFNIKDKVDIVGYACMKNDVFALGGEVIRTSKRNIQIIKFFMNNHNKRFMLYDAASYFRILTNPEQNLTASIMRINHRAKKLKREKIIIVKNDWCYFNPEIANYVCEDPPEDDLETDGGIIIFSLTDRY